MTSRHRIRLAGPWKVTVADSFSHPQYIGSTLKMRCEMPPAGSGRGKIITGHGIAERKFNRPSGLSGDSRVWVCIDDPRGVVRGGEVALNDQPLEAQSLKTKIMDRLEYQVQRLLLPFNCLSLTVDLSKAGALLSPDQSIHIALGVYLAIDG